MFENKQQKQERLYDIVTAYDRGFKSGYEMGQKMQLKQESKIETNNNESKCYNDEICNDNRFEIIAKAKEDIINHTNIEDNEYEMKALDTILFRAWQMGWLTKYEPCENVLNRECNNCAYYVNGANDEACDGCFEDEYKHPNFKAKNDNEIIHCKDCKYRDYWGDCTKWSKELDAHKSYILDENMFCGFAKIKDGK